MARVTEGRFYRPGVLTLILHVGESSSSIQRGSSREGGGRREGTIALRSVDLRVVDA